MRNPAWKRDELILALDLYFRLQYGQMDGKHPEVHKLSRLLNQLSEEGYERSVSSIPLKLANFKRFDPKYTGKGMKSGSKLDGGIWSEFANDRERLKQASEKIRRQLVEKSIRQRKNEFADWLKNATKSDGSQYQEKTIRNYANQLQKTIQREFGLSMAEEEGLYGIKNTELLRQIGQEIERNIDSKRRKDLQSAFHNYERFVREETLLDDPTEIPEEYVSRTEGGERVFISKRAERKVKLRNQAIAIHGTCCQACGFDFSQKYGTWGEGFIEVHHLIPLSEGKDSERVTDPVKDLVVLCSNCHRMVHRKKNVVLSLDELIQKIQIPFAV